MTNFPAMSVRKDLDSVIQSASLALGYPQLRSKQYDAVKSFLEGNDVFVVLPTGSGKSLCYSLLPLAFNTLLGRESSIVIVISPLKALMKDQVLMLFFFFFLFFSASPPIRVLIGSFT